MSEKVEVGIGGEGEVSHIIKRGEVVSTIGLHRSLMGLTLSVKVHPGIEEFFRANSLDHEPIDVRTIGRHWQPVEKDKILRIYRTQLKEEILPFDDGRGEGRAFRLDRAGNTLLDENGYINLSFLKLVGASDGAGITFGVSGVYTLEAMNKLKGLIERASVKFYSHYLKPVDLIVMTVTQQM